MFYIKNLDSNIIDLNNDISDYEFIIISKDDNNSSKEYDIIFVSNEFISVKKYDNIILVNINIDKIMKEEVIILSNVLKEKLIIKVLPNSFVAMEKIYKFKITKKSYEDDGSLKIKILSTVNDMEIGWKCTYDGKPMSYSIEPFTSDKSCYVTIKLMSNVLSSFSALIEFTQDKSNEKISLSIYNTPEGIKKKVD